MESLIYLYALITFVFVYALKRYLIPGARHLPLPPGPKPKPIIGNLLDLPQPGQHDWLHWANHKDMYGSISSVTVMGQTMVILNDLQIAIDLLDKKSAIFSDRPVFVFSGIMLGWENTLMMLRYGERFRLIRKTLHHAIGTNIAMRKFDNIEDIEVRRFLLKVLRNPAELAEHIRNLTGALILSISHGYQVEHEKPDPMVALADEVLVDFAQAAQPGVWLVDYLPFLRFLPGWMPGMGFKRTAARWARKGAEFVEKPHAFTKQQMAAGVARPSLTQDLLDAHGGVPSPEEEYIIKWSASTIYGGGSDTTVSATQSFFLAMCRHPEVQRAAQAELDAVVGPDRLPAIADRARLPYVDALVKELLRAAPVVPMGVPHVASEDYVYNGYLIPKGTMLLTNIWQMNHDPNTFRDPHSFAPERFLGTDGRTPELDPHDISFGFGRRICPGKELADTTLFLTIAMALAVFDISAPLDASGKPIIPSAGAEAYTTGVMSRPIECVAVLRPRSVKAEALIHSVAHEHPFEKGDSEALEGLKWEKQPAPFPATY